MKIWFLRCSQVALCLLIAFIQVDARACTTFQLKHADQVLVGKNYDWMVEDGLIIVNKRGVSKNRISAHYGQHRSRNTGNLDLKIRQHYVHSIRSGVGSGWDERSRSCRRIHGIVPQHPE